jgi:acyl dehydratase
MTERERLVELITNGFYTKPVYEALCTNKRKACDFLADYLLENGVIVPPVKVGDTVYTNVSWQGWYLRDKDKPYKAKVVYIGINGSKNYVNVVYEKNDNMMTFTFDEIGDRIFLTREEAEKAVASK